MLNNYFKLAIKVLLRRKFFTFVSLFGISLTLVVLMVATALIDHLIATHPPDTKSARTLGIFSMKLSGPTTTSNSAPGYKFLSTYVKGRMTVPETISISQAGFNRVTGFAVSDQVRVYLKRVDGEFWKILDFEFVEGDAFTVDDQDNANFVAVINEATRRKFFGSESAVGKTIDVDSQKFIVRGVVRDVPINRLNAFSDVWVPISTSKSTAYLDEFIGGYQGLVLARSTADLPAIRREFEEVLTTVEIPDPDSYDKVEVHMTTRLEFVALGLFGFTSVWPLVAGFFGLCVLFMLLPTINLVNLNLSRIMERASEIGVRKSFGAKRSTLVGQFVVENLILTLIGGTLGLILTTITLALVNSSGLIPYSQLSINFRIFAWGILTTVVFGLVSGVFPAWRMSRLHPVEALRGRSR